MATKILTVAPNDTEVAIGGYSPVSYFQKGRAERGDARFAVHHGGRVYHMASEEQVAEFRANPDRFVPAYGGWCAYGMSMNKNFPVDPENYKVVDGRLMLFLKNDEVDARKLWNRGDESDMVGTADRAWNGE